MDLESVNKNEEESVTKENDYEHENNGDNENNEDSKIIEEVKVEKEEKPKPQYFTCSNCNLREEFEYFGNEPTFAKSYRLQENAYIIEEPFQAPKQGEILVLGAHCIKCGKSVCKDNNCSFYFDGTLCIPCAKQKRMEFPESVREKLNKIVLC